MGREARYAGLSLLALLAFLCISCPARRDDLPEKDQPFPKGAEVADPVENSGVTLAGEYVFEVASDAYSTGGGRDRLQAIIKFDEGGSFKRDRVFRESVQSSEAGSYIISTQNELVLYIENEGGEQMQSARDERYSINRRTEDRIDLEIGSKQLFLRRR